MQMVYRFIAGGLIVTLFAVVGGILKPKTFAGLFGAAPSVALATLTLTIVADGKAYAAREAHSMVAGAIGFCVYSYVCSYVIGKKNWHPALATISGLLLWFACSVGAWRLVTK